MMKHFQTLFKNMSGEKDIRRILFNIVTICGSLGGIGSLIMSSVLLISDVQIVAIWLAEFVLVFSFWLANWKKRLNMAAVLIIGVITLILFPVMFVTGGGLYGGMSLWFSIGIVFNFLLIEGIACYILLALQAIVVLSCYWYAYSFPEKIVPLASEWAVYIDTIQSLLIISIAIGLIVKFQNKVYKNKLKELESLNISLEKAKDEANEANKAKSDFLANMSHEIRTPVNAVVGMNEMILREARDRNLIEYASAVENSANALLSIINDILDISSIEAGKMELTENPYTTVSLVKDCYTFVKERADKKGLTIDVDVDSKLPRRLHGDAVRVRQIVVNFLTNAIKYSDKGSIYFSTKCLKSEMPDMIILQVTVRDQGIGIKEENLAHIFDKFERFDLQKNRNIEGTGLGLNITKMLVDMMEGDIQVESIYGKGSTFTVNIPQKIVDSKEVGFVEPGEITQISTDRRDYHQLFQAPDAKILLVDDVAINHSVFCNLVKDTLIQVDKAASGMEAIEMTKEKMYDLIFMDHMMPHMDGIEAFEYIRSEGKNTKTPVIMLTANAVSGMEDIFREKGFADYLAKPIDGTKLELMMIKHLPADKVTDTRTNIDTVEGTYNPEASLAQDIASEAAAESEFGEQEINLEHVKSIAGIDYAFAMTQCMNNEELYLDILKDYCQPSHREELIKKYEEKDYETYRVLVHALKSNSRIVGFPELGNQAEKQEKAIKTNDMEYVVNNHDALMQAYEKIVKNIYFC